MNDPKITTENLSQSETLDDSPSDNDGTGPSGEHDGTGPDGEHDGTGPSGEHDGHGDGGAGHEPEPDF